MMQLLQAERQANYWANRYGLEADEQYTYWMNFIEWLIKSVDNPDYCKHPVKQSGTGLTFPSY